MQKITFGPHKFSEPHEQFIASRHFCIQLSYVRSTVMTSIKNRSSFWRDSPVPSCVCNSRSLVFHRVRSFQHLASVWFVRSGKDVSFQCKQFLKNKSQLFYRLYLIMFWQKMISSVEFWGNRAIHLDFQHSSHDTVLLFDQNWPEFQPISDRLTPKYIHHLGM